MSAYILRKLKVLLTVAPSPRCCTNDFAVVFLMVDNRLYTETHNSQWRDVFRCGSVRLRKWVDVLRIANGGFYSAPRDLRKNAVRYQSNLS